MTYTALAITHRGSHIELLLSDGISNTTIAVIKPTDFIHLETGDKYLKKLGITFSQFIQMITEGG